MASRDPPGAGEETEGHATDEEAPEGETCTATETGGDTAAATDGGRAGSTTIPPAEREALVTVGRGAVVAGSGNSLQRALAAATEYALSQGLSPVVYGVYAFGWRVTQLLFRVVTFGSVQTLQRYLGAGEAPDRRGRVMALAYLTTVVVGLAVAAALVLGADRLNALTVADATFPPTIRLFAVLVVLVGVIQVHAGVLRAVRSARGEALFNRVLRPAVRLGAVLLALALGYSIVGVVGAIVVGTGALAVLGAPVVVATSGVRPVLRGVAGEARRFYDHAGPIALSSLGKVFQNRVDVLLVGFLLTANAAGVYNVVLVLVSLTWIPLLSFNMLLPPVASRLYADGDLATLDAVYTAVTRLIVTCVVPVLVVLVVYGRPILAVFGPRFTAGYLPLVVYLGGVLVGSAVGATGWLLMMTDHQYARMALDWLLAVLNAVLTLLFVRALGLVGAALGTALAIAVQNGIQVLLLRRFEGLWPFDATFLTPLAAGGVAGLAMLVVRTVVPGPGAVPIGVLVGGGVYLGTLLVLGVDDRDRLVVGALRERYWPGAGVASGAD